MLASTGRRGLRRLFDPGVVERLALIALGRSAGFSLDEIARKFAPEGQPRIDRQLSQSWPGPGITSNGRFRAVSASAVSPVGALYGLLPSAANDR